MDQIALLKSGDAVGFTFFTGYMAMLAASIFFWFERSRVSEKWKLSLLISGLITFIAAVHYYYMRDVWVTQGVSPTEFRYIDWTLTVPLMCTEFYLLLRPAGASVGMLWRLIAASVLMLVAGYLGEGIFRDQTILWGCISTVGWAIIVAEIFFGEARKLADNSKDPAVKGAFNLLCGFVFIGWAIYPIGYMFMPGNLFNMGGETIPPMLDLIYNIGDAVNKIGFGLVIYTMAATTIKETAV